MGSLRSSAPVTLAALGLAGCACGDGNAAEASAEGTGDAEGDDGGSSADGSDDGVDDTGATADAGDTGDAPDECGHAFAGLPSSLALGYVSDLAVADLDADGVLDLLTCRASPEVPSAFSVSMGVAPGSFDAPTDYEIIGVHDVEVGDFDEDGILDAIVVGFPSDATILRGQGDGTLVELGTVGVGSTNCYDLAVADIDGDGHLDFATSCESQETTTDDNEQAIAFVGAGDGTFTHFATLSMLEPHGLHLADLDDDGLPELLATSFPDLFLAYSNTGTDFELAASVALEWAGDIDAGDFDGDGDLDVVVGQEWNSTLDGALAVLTNDGGTLAPPVFVDLEGRPYSVAAADFDRDGALDLATVGSDGYLQIASGSGDGTFEQGDIFGAGSAPWAIAVPDLDGDDDPDILHSSARGVTVRVDEDGAFEELPRIPAPDNPFAVVVADFDDDGEHDLAIAGETTLELRLGHGDATFAEPWSGAATDGMLGMAAGDVDGDGRLDLAFASAAGIGVRLGDGAGALAEPTMLDASPVTGAPRIADVDGDGIGDVVAPRDGGVIVVVGDGGEVLSHSIDGIGVQAVATGDLDGDDAIDYAVAEGQNLHVLYGDGAAGVREQVVVPAGAGISRVVIADIDGDGDSDVVSDGSNHPAGVIFGGVAWFANDGGTLAAAQSTDPAGLLVQAVFAFDLDRDGKDDIVTMENANMVMSVYRGADGPSLQHQGTYAVTGIELADWLRDRDAGIAIADFDGDGFADVVFADLARDSLLFLPGMAEGGDCPTE